MKFKVFAIFDQAAGAFLPPWVLPTEALALRQLRELPDTQPQHPFVKFAEQYTLFSLAEFDDSTGMFEEVRQEAIRNLRILFAKGPVSVDSVQEKASA